MDDERVSDHYIEVTALVGPIGDPPFVLHTFADNGDATDTVHGELAIRMFDSLYKVDQDIYASATIVTEDEMEARADALSIRAERDRLRAVAVAARAYVDEVPAILRDDVSAREDSRLGDLIDAVDALDVSPEVTDG
jgi:hypothetical protein